MAHYRKIDTRIWGDKKFNELSDDGKLLFFLLLTHPYLTSVGAMRGCLPGFAEDLHWPLERVEKAFQEIFAKGMVKYDEKAPLVWLPNFIKYNQPESPNVIKGWGNALNYIPESSLKNLIVEHLTMCVSNCTESFREAFKGVLLNTFPNQEQEQEQ